MSAREIIAKAINEHWANYPSGVADAILTALTSAGYRIVGPGEVDAALDAALKAEIIPSEGNPGHGVNITDYLNYTAEDAVELGVVLQSRDADGKPKFHGISDIRVDEREDVHKAILRPAINAALAALKGDQNDG